MVKKVGRRPMARMQLADGGKTPPISLADMTDVFVEGTSISGSNGKLTMYATYDQDNEPDIDSPMSDTNSYFKIATFGATTGATEVGADGLVVPALGANGCDINTETIAYLVISAEVTGAVLDVKWGGSIR